MAAAISMNRLSRKKVSVSLSVFILENCDDIDAIVDYTTLAHPRTDQPLRGGEKCLIVFVLRGKRRMSSIPKEWEGWPVQIKWAGKRKIVRNGGPYVNP